MPPFGAPVADDVLGLDLRSGIPAQTCCIEVRDCAHWITPLVKPTHISRQRSVSTALQPWPR